ncbi:glycoside hydrolase family 76 protein [Favolaschia claudopus]|uniref:Glycoside hydrolase family 76 protein n=1 Tax=Favolaschia claudopus TaxID=2862362 RepID=A0AAW0DY57_9AGAR
MSSIFSAVSLALLTSSLVSAKCQKYVDAAVAAAENLQSTYFVNGGYGSQQPWIGAVDSFHLTELDDLAGISTHADVINTVFTAWQGQLDNDNSYDDVQWVSIAYLRAGNLAQAQKYYDIASILERPPRLQKCYCAPFDLVPTRVPNHGTQTNELFITSSGFLFDVTKDDNYLSNAQSTWSWLKASGMMGSNGLFNDGLTNVDGVCKNNEQTQWTYNQGALLPGLAYLFKYTGDETTITSAWAIMDAIIASMTIDGGLREPCEITTQNNCNADQQTFKGITMHWMSWFLSVSGRDNDSKYSNFIRSQADKVLQFAVGAPNSYSNLWYGANAGSAVWTASTQASALGALIAAGQQNC